MTDIKYQDYKQNKAKGLWLAVKTDKGTAIQRKQFAVDTGNETTPTFEYFDVGNLTAEKTRLQKLLADINTLLTDTDTLTTPTI